VSRNHPALPRPGQPAPAPRARPGDGAGVRPPPLLLPLPVALPYSPSLLKESKEREGGGRSLDDFENLRAGGALALFSATEVVPPLPPQREIWNEYPRI